MCYLEESRRGSLPDDEQLNAPLSILLYAEKPLMCSEGICAEKPERCSELLLKLNNIHSAVTFCQREVVLFFDL